MPITSLYPIVIHTNYKNQITRPMPIETIKYIMQETFNLNHSLLFDSTQFYTNYSLNI